MNVQPRQIFKPTAELNKRLSGVDTEYLDFFYIAGAEYNHPKVDFARKAKGLSLAFNGGKTRLDGQSLVYLKRDIVGVGSGTVPTGTDPITLCIKFRVVDLVASTYKSIMGLNVEYISGTDNKGLGMQIFATSSSKYDLQGIVQSDGQDMSSLGTFNINESVVAIFSYRPSDTYIRAYVNGTYINLGTSRSLLFTDVDKVSLGNDGIQVEWAAIARGNLWTSFVDPKDGTEFYSDYTRQAYSPILNRKWLAPLLTLYETDYFLTASPEPRLSMPELLIPGRKPVGDVEIDWTHPLSEGLVLCDISRRRRPLNLANGKTAAYVKGSYTSGIGEFIADYNNGDRLRHAVDIPSDEFTLIVSADVAAWPQWRDIVSVEFAYDNLIVLENSDSGFITPKIYAINSTATQITNAATISQTDAVSGVFVYVNSATRNISELYFNGSLIGSSTGYSSEGRISSIEFFNRHNDAYSRASSGILTRTLVYSKALSAAEIKQLHENPYQFLKPKAPAFFPIPRSELDNDQINVPTLKTPELLIPRRKPVGDVEIDWDDNTCILRNGDIVGLLRSVREVDISKNYKSKGVLRGISRIEGNNLFVSNSSTSNLDGMELPLMEKHITGCTSVGICIEYETNDATAFQPLLARWRDDAYGYSLYLVHHSTNTIRCIIPENSDSATPYTGRYSDTLTGTRHRAVINWHGGDQWSMYVDGKKQAMTVFASSNVLSLGSTGNSSLFLGRRANADSNSLNGTIYNYVIRKNGVFTAEEARQYMENPYRFLKPKSTGLQLPKPDHGLFLPDSRFEMPELFIPGRKPVGNVMIDWSNPLTRGLEFYAPFVDFTTRDLVSGQYATTLSDVNYATHHGEVEANDWALLNTLVYDSAPSLNKGKGAVLIRVSGLKDASYTRLFDGGGTGYNNTIFYQETDKYDVNMRFAGTSVRMVAGPPTVFDVSEAIAKPHTLVLQWDSSKALREYWVDGVLRASVVNSFDATQWGSKMCFFGKVDGTSGVVGGKRELGYFNRLLEPQEIRAIHENPHQFLIPAED